MNNIADINKSISNVIRSYENNFVELISKKLGIHINNNQRDELIKTITEGCKNLNCSPFEYLSLLEKADDKSPLLDHMIAGITVGETYFFRDKKQMNELEHKILPEIILRKRKTNNLTLRVWSAGCSSGEEIYTIAMMLRELLPDINNWSISLLGTDINLQALNKAVTGRYGEWSMRSISDKYKKKYFNIDNNKYTCIDPILNMVKFDYINLNSDSFPSLGNNTNAQDVILCRNVLIYFQRTTIKDLMSKLSNCLIYDGVLMLGASDPIELQTSELSSYRGHCNIFSRVYKSDSLIDDVKVSTNQYTVIRKLDKTKNKINTRTINTPLSANKSNSGVINTVVINDLINKNDWIELVRLTNHLQLNSKPLLNARAMALANIGDLKQACMIFEKSLSIDKMDKYTYFYYALVLTELNQIDKAEILLKKAIYLDSDFVTAHYQLGLLLLKARDKSFAMKSLTRALKIASLKFPNDKVPGQHELTYSRLVEILQYEIEIYASKGEREHANKEPIR